MNDTQTQIERLIELAIVQRTELKQLVEQLPQLREHLNAEIERTIEEVEPQLRAELEDWTTKQTADQTAKLGAALEAKITELAKALEVSTQARYSAILAEREKNFALAAEAEAKIAEHAASLPDAVKGIVDAELARFPRAGEIDQLRKEFAEPRGLNPRGKWSPDETYNRLDLVAYNGDSYVSNRDGNSERPSRTSAEWTLSAARGAGGGGGGITSLNDVLNAPTSGQIIGSENGQYVPKTLAAGANITITETANTITIIGDEGQISLSDGTAASPSLHFTNDPDTGIYRPAANTLGISVSGTQVAYFDENGLTIPNAGIEVGGSVHAANGNANNPSHSFTSDQDTGFFRHATNQIGVSTSGTAGLIFTDKAGELLGHTGVSVTFGAGSSGATIALGQGTNGAVTITPKGSGTAVVNGTTIPASKTLVVTTDKLSALASTTSSELAGVISDETGTGSLVFANTPTLVTPNIGAATGTSVNLTGTVTASGTGSHVFGTTNTVTMAAGVLTTTGAGTFGGGLTVSGGGNFGAALRVAPSSGTAYGRLLGDPFRADVFQLGSNWTGGAQDDATKPSWYWFFDSRVAGDATTLFRVPAGGSSAAAMTISATATTFAGNLTVSGAGQSSLSSSSALFAVGTSTPTSTNTVGVPQIVAESDLYSSVGSIAHNTTDGNYGFFLAGKSRGTKASPLIVANGDRVGGYGFIAYDGAAYRTSAEIVGVIDGTPGAGDLPTRLSFRVAADGSASASEQMRLTSTGNLLLGTTTDGGQKLQVNGNSGFLGHLEIPADKHIYMKQGNPLRWSSDGLSTGTVRADIYADSGAALYFRTNGTTQALTLDSSQNATFAGTTVSLADTTSNNTRIFSHKKTAPAVNHNAQVVLAQGVGDGFGANDRTYQLVNIGASSTATNFVVQYWNGSTYSERLKIDSAGDATFGGSVKTAAPSGGTAANWKLGTVASVSPTSPNRTIEVDIGGTIYYIHAKTTNN
jgi:hypothetical protein